ncbi:MAG: hypothetical protein ACI8Y4_001999 [Candidatus Poriferisodalaceae bacterium]|jgi:hypothetical protein
MRNTISQPVNGSTGNRNSSARNSSSQPGAWAALAIVVVTTLIAGLLGGKALAGMRNENDASPVVTAVAHGQSTDVAAPELAQAVGSFKVVEIVEEGALELNAPSSSQQEAGADELGVSSGDVATLFVADFNEAHASGDVTFLLDTLHPVAYDAFGSAACVEYVNATMGSIAGMTVTNVGERTSFDLPSPEGPLSFSGAIPIEAEWTVVHSGESQSVVFHLIDVGHMQFWLTTCGWSADQA